MPPHRLRMLMVTPADYLRMWDNTEHSRARYYARAGCDVTLLFKRHNTSARWADLLLDTCTCRVRPGREGAARLVEIDPLFNYYAGYRSQAETELEACGTPATLRHRLIRLFSPLAVLRDVFFVPCFVVVALIMLRARFDVGMGFGPWGGIVVWLLHKLGRVATVVYEDRDYEAGLKPDRLRQRYTAAVENFCLRRADLVVSIGHRLATLRRREVGCAAVVVPSGVTWSAFEPARAAPKNGCTLLYVGKLLSWDGLEVAIQAMPRIVARLPAARLRVIGAGQPAYEELLRGMVRRLGVEAVVDFLGSRPPRELPELLSRADLGLANSKPVPYRRYACPLKVIEYLAAGLPVIATRETEAADLVAHYGAGEAIDYDADAFASTVIRVLEDRALYHRLHTSALQRGPELDWDRLLAGEMQHVLSTTRRNTARTDDGV